MNKEQVLQLKKQFEKQIEKWKKLKVSDGYLKNLKKLVTNLEEIINTGDYNSERSKALIYASKVLLKFDKFRYQAMSLSGPVAEAVLSRELIAIKKKIERKKLSSKK